MRSALLPTLLVCLPACLVVDGGGDDTHPPQGATRVVAAGTSYGECAGYCINGLAIDGSDVTLTISGWGELADLLNTGTLTPAAVDELDDLADALANADLLETYGCPDCDDGGAAHLDLVVGDIASRSTWEHGNPPPVLTGADALLFDDLIRALTDCVATPRVSLGTCSSPY